MFILIFIFEVVTFLSTCYSSEPNKRIINGTRAEDGLYPWIAHLKFELNGLRYYCGATIISNEWLLTAAHCTWRRGDYDKGNPDFWNVQIGSTTVVVNKMSKQDQQHQPKIAKPLHFRVEKIIIHPAHKVGILYYDIALMKIKGRIPYIWKKSVPASLPTGRLSEQWPLMGTKCIIIGWGCTRYGGKRVDTAFVVELEVASAQMCYGFFRVDLGHEFCAGYHNLGKGTCNGDSGNGLMCEHQGLMTIAGVSSAVHRSEPENFPSIFVRVTAVIDWIRKTMAQN
ncbi:hypothetical protein AHF37_07885 [Paragonimus kellicotti]|nr:hypothetical protein AHF37_07885 [Paragonimus kellicotti]